MTRLILQHTVFSVLSFFCFSANSFAENKLDELYNLVGSEVGLCLELSDLTHQTESLLSSPLAERFSNLSAFQSWKHSPKFQQLEQTKREIEKLLGQPVDSTMQQLFGNSVILAIYTVPNSEPTGITLTRASNQRVIDQVITAWNKAEPQETKQIKFKGKTYFSRTRLARPKHPEKTVFYFRDSQILGFSDNEQLIKKTLELLISHESSSNSSKALRTLPTFLKAHSSTHPSTAAFLYVNPRAWDQILEQSQPKNQAEQYFNEFWKSCESISLGFNLTGGASIELSIRLEQQTETNGWLNFVKAVQGPPDFLKQVPKRALLLFAGRHGLDVLSQFHAPSQNLISAEQLASFRQISRGLLLGLDLFDDIFPQLPSNWGGYLVPRTNHSSDRFPIDGLIAIELPPSSTQTEKTQSKTVTVQTAIANGCNTAFNLLAAFHNGSKSAQPAAIVRSEETNKTHVHWIDNIDSFQPTFAVSDRFLIFATAPDVVQEFLTLPESESILASPQFQAWKKHHFSEMNQVLFLNFAMMQNSLQERKKFLVEYFSQHHQETPKSTERKLERFEEFLSVLDGSVVAWKFESDRFQMVLSGFHQENNTEQPARSTQ